MTKFYIFLVINITGSSLYYIFVQSLKKNCGGEYVNIDPSNTKCLKDMQAYEKVCLYKCTNEIDLFIYLLLFIKKNKITKLQHIRQCVSGIHFLHISQPLCSIESQNVEELVSGRRLTSENTEPRCIVSLLF